MIEVARVRPGLGSGRPARRDVGLDDLGAALGARREDVVLHALAAERDAAHVGAPDDVALRRRRGLEQRGDGDAEHLADAVERADGGRGLAALDRADERLGEARLAGDVVERHAAALAGLAQPAADQPGRPALVGAVAIVSGGRLGHRLRTVASG